MPCRLDQRGDRVGVALRLVDRQVPRRLETLQRPVDVPDRRCERSLAARHRRGRRRLPSSYQRPRVVGLGMEGVRDPQLALGAQHPREGVVRRPEPGREHEPAISGEGQRAPDLRVHAVVGPHGVGDRPGELRFVLEEEPGEPDRVAAHVLDGPAGQLGEQADVARGRPARSGTATRSRGPRRSPHRRSSPRTRSICSWNGKTKASQSGRTADRATASTRSVSSGVAHKGFSQRTAFPASSAAIVHSACSPFGSGM